MKETFLITGCPRSGTNFISSYFKKNGYNVGHEEFVSNFHGISSWFHILNDPNLYPAWSKRKNIGNKMEYRKIIHQLRDPIKCISSMVTLSPTSINLMRDVLNIKEKDKVKLLMKIWLGWNKMIEEKSNFSYVIEDIEIILPNLNKELDINLKNISLSKKVNSRHHRPIIKEELLKKDKYLTNEIIEYYNKIKL